MTTLNILSTLFLLSITVGIHSQQYSDCISVLQSLQSVGGAGNLSPTFQGRPGKVGPMGPAGPPGVKGNVGECECSVEDDFRTMSEKLKGFLKKFERQTLTKQDSCEVGAAYKGVLPDSAFSASSEYNRRYKAEFGRLRFQNQDKGPKRSGWVPTEENRKGSWLQVDFGEMAHVVGVIIQGPAESNYCNNSGTCRVKTFKISHGTDIDSLQYIQDGDYGDKVFQGNVEDDFAPVTNYFNSIETRIIRIYPHTYHFYPMLRVEFLKC